MIKIPLYETSNFVFSNFSAHAIEFKGKKYMTAEHAFHAVKFDDLAIREEIRNAGSPLEAFNLGKKYKPMRRTDWNEIKVDMLYQILKNKAEQHEEVKDALLATGDEEIVEVNPHDDFWGDGPDGNGQNHTGKIWMRIRSELNS